jgi:hypothetical protein
MERAARTATDSHPGQTTAASYRFKDNKIKKGKKYRYRLELLKTTGPSQMSEIIRIKIK